MSAIDTSVSSFALAPMPAMVIADPAVSAAVPAVPSSDSTQVAPQAVVDVPATVDVPVAASQEAAVVDVPLEVAPVIDAPQEVAPRMVPPSVAALVEEYALQLITPLVNGMLRPDLDVNAFEAWLNSGSVFPAEQVARIREKYANNQEQDTRPVEKLAEAVVDVVGSEIFSTIDSSPWTILRRIQAIPYIAQLFGIPQGTTTLPVKVVSGPNTYLHQLTEDQVLGILLYPEAINVELSLYDKPITRDFLFNLPNSFQEGYVMLTVGDQNYLGHDASLLSGYISGAEWAGRNPADITSHLKISVVQGGQLVPAKMA